MYDSWHVPSHLHLVLAIIHQCMPHSRMGSREKRVISAGVIGRSRTWKTRCHLSADDNVFLGVWSFGLKLKHEFPKLTDDTLYITLSSSKKMTHEKMRSHLLQMCKWKIRCDLLSHITQWKLRCDLFQRWQHINCVYIFKERWNIENDAVIFSQITTHFLSSFQTDKVAKWTLWSVWKITTQKLQSHLSEITT